MKIFIDEKLTSEIKDNVIDFGIVAAGSPKKFIFYVFNNSEAELDDLKFDVEQNITEREIKILEAPVIIRANSVGKLVIEVNPSITLKQGIKAQLKITGIELWS